VSRRRSPRFLAAGLALLAAVAGCGSADPVDGQRIERVLIVSMPGVAWADVQRGALPNLADFARGAAIGDLSTRIGLRSASTTDAYLSIGAGTRAIAPRVDPAVAVDPDERYAGVASAEILQRRLGFVPQGITYLPVGAALERNERSSFGAKPGRLGDLLAAHGVDRAVIANADAAEGFVSDEPPPDGAYARGAATALMTSEGLVPGGTVGRGLLTEDPLAPFGRRLDPAAVMAAFDEVWGPDRSVVLVEASDLSRAAAYSPRATSVQRRELRDDALERSDDLLGDLVAQTDPDHDAVLVVSPVAARGNPELAVVALRTPDGAAGLLRSPTTRRDGYVQLADVAPTVLALLDLDQPQEIEGRAFEVSDVRTSGRVAKLVDQAEAAEFRDSLSPVVVPLVIAYLALLLGASLAGRRVPDRIRRSLPAGCLGALGVVPATFLAARLSAVRGSTGGYLLAVVAMAAVFAAGVTVLTRNRRGLAPVLAVGAVTGFFVLDVLAGAPLQLNAVFGYSVAVAGRFAGLGNLAFALFGAGAIVLGGQLAERYGDRGRRWALAVLAGIVLVEGLPMLGADVGGVVSMVPAFGVTALILSGRRVGWRWATGLLVAAMVAVLAFAFVDAARPTGSRTHLARLAQHVLDGRWGPFFDTLNRRFHASFGDVEVAAWASLVALVLGTTAYVVVIALRRSRPELFRRRTAGLDVPTLAVRNGLFVLAVIGLAANDSSIAVPATMLIIAVPAFILQDHASDEVRTP
jgi:hypothetical protein